MNNMSFNPSPYPDVLPGLGGRFFGTMVECGYAPEIVGPMLCAAIKLVTHDSADLARDGHPRQVTGLNATVLVPSGMDTSSFMAKLLSPIHGFGAAQVHMAQENAEQITIEHRVWAARMKGIEGSIAKFAYSSYQVEELKALLKEVAAAEPKVPEAASVICCGTTLKDLRGHFKRWSSAGVFLGEGAVWPMAHSVKDLVEYIKLIDGDPHQVYRAGTGEIAIPSPRLAIGLVIPTERYLAHREVAERVMVDSGFDARFIFSVVDYQQPAILVDSPALQGVLAEYNQQVDKLLWQSVRPDRQGPSDRRPIKPSPQAEVLLQRLESQMQRDRMGIYRPIDGYAARHPGNSAKLAASLAVFEGVEGDIPLDFVERAEVLCRYHLDRYLQYFSVPIKISKEMADAQLLMKVLQTERYIQRPHGDLFKQSTIRRLAVNWGLNRSRFDRAFEQLCMQGILQMTDFGAGAHFRLIAPSSYQAISACNSPGYLPMMPVFQM